MVGIVLVLLLGGGLRLYGRFYNKREEKRISVQTTPSPLPTVSPGGFGGLIQRKTLPWTFTVGNEKQRVEFSTHQIKFSFECPKELHPQTSTPDEKGMKYLVKFFSSDNSPVFSFAVIEKPLDEYIKESIYKKLKWEEVSFAGITGKMYRSLFEGKKEQIFLLFPYPNDSKITLSLIVLEKDVLDLNELLDSFRF